MKQLITVLLAISTLGAPVFVKAQTMVISTVAGNGTDGFSGDGGPATAAQLFSPQDVAVDATGNLYIADYRNHRIRKVDAATGIIHTIAGQGFSSFAGDGGPASAAYLSYPSEVKLDGAGNIYINDGLNKRIRKITASTGVITTIAGGGTLNYYNGIAATAINDSFSPAGMAVDPAGNCYFMDAGPSFLHPRILRLDAATGMVTAIIDTAGIEGFSGDGGPAADAKISNLHFYPGVSVGIDQANNIYVTDVNNMRIRKVDHTTGIITTIAGNGTGGLSGDGGPATAAQLSLPNRIAIDNSGSLYFFNYNLIRKIDGATQTITTIAGGGSSFAEGIPATSAKIYSPYGISIDDMNNVFYVDNNGRVRKLTPACTGATAGSISSSAGNTFCDSGNTTLNLTGASAGADISYQWKSSADGVNWTNTGTGAASYVTGTLHATTYFKTIVTCNTSGMKDSTAVDTITIQPHFICATGVKTVAATAALEIYPNPNDGTFNISLSSTKEEQVRVTVVNVTGEKVKDLMITTNTVNNINLSAPTGIYFLLAATGSKNYISKIVVAK